MLFLSFLSQKTYPEEFLRPEVIEAEVIYENVVFGRASPYHPFVIF